MAWFRRNKAEPESMIEATQEQLVATGSIGGYGAGGIDPIDGDRGYAPVGSVQGRPIPLWSLEKLRAYSVNAWRMNPMARAVVDTYTSFCVGDSGVKLHCTNDDVEKAARAFWDDQKNRMGEQDVALRSHMLNGETVYEMLVGESTGAVRRSVIDPARIVRVGLEGGNPLWPNELEFRLSDGTPKTLSVATVDDMSGLRVGEAQFWASWRALETDVRGWPFLAPIIDWLESYDAVLSNLVDRTALARYLVWVVKVKGGETSVDDFIEDRKKRGLGTPQSGTIEVTNENIDWELKTADVGATEDTTTATAILTLIAAGAGIAKTWLAEGEGANRATALTMAEPVRRRVGGVQNVWLGYQTELARYAVDQAVAAHRLPEYVATTDSKGSVTQEKVRASETVHITGPEIAAADAQVTAGILLQLSRSLVQFRSIGALSEQACAVAARKAWEDFVGLPYTSELDQPDGSRVDDLATEIDQTAAAAASPLGRLVGLSAS